MRRKQQMQKNTLGIANCTFKIMQNAFADFSSQNCPKRLKRVLWTISLPASYLVMILANRSKKAQICVKYTEKLYIPMAQKTIRNICYMINRNLMTEEFWTTEYEVDFYTTALHCNRQRYSVLRIIYALLLEKWKKITPLDSSKR